MNYVKSCLIITMLLGVGYSQDCDPDWYNCDCNEDTWQEYYNSEGHNMEGCYLEGADLRYADLAGANLSCVNFTDANLWDADLYDTTWDDECGITDSNADGYDDVSYDAGAVSGDLNLDGLNNVLDVVSVVNIALNP